MNYWAHESAVIDEGASIGELTKIWHFSHVCSGAIIGKKCVLGQNIYVGGTVNIGNRVKIQNNVSVYDSVTIEDDVFCGPSMVFTNVNNPRAFIERKDSYLETIVRKGASLGANCTIVCGAIIGKYAFIGAGAVVISDVPDFALMVGNPCRQIGWVGISGDRLNLPLKGNAELKCADSNETYILRGEILTIA